jgi:hypothetical protein
LHDGASATVSIIYHQLTNVLTVPTAAVHSSAGGSYVYVSSHGKKARRVVTTGLSGGGSTQIKSGLRAGEQVYLELSAGSGRSGSSSGQNSKRVDFPGGGVFLPGGGKVPAGGGGKLPVTSGGGK